MVLADKQIQACAENASAFLRVAESLSEAGTLALLTTRVYPLVVNAALAVELYLKALLAVKSPRCSIPMVHKLKELYEKLDSSTQNEIDEAFAQKSEMPLKDVLDESNDAFVAWRYAHENEVGLHPCELVTLARVLRDYFDCLVAE